MTEDNKDQKPQADQSTPERSSKPIAAKSFEAARSYWLSMKKDQERRAIEAKKRAEETPDSIHKVMEPAMESANESSAKTAKR